MQDYRKLKVWDKGHEVTLEVYKITKAFPKEELYGLTSQMRRAASSIPTNIAEGCGRNSNPQLVQFLSIATGSAFELDYQLLLARDLGFLPANTYEAIHDKVDNLRRMLNNLMQTLRKTNNE